jgi:hypothetical protein
MDRSLQLEGLDGPSRTFAERVLSLFPDWRKFASVETSKARPSFSVEVPSPTGDASRNLAIWLEDGVASFEFGEWHTHADLWKNENEFLRFLEDVIADRQLFLFVETWATRWSLLEEPIVEAIENALTGESAPDVIRILSWSGKKDRIVRRSDL